MSRPRQVKVYLSAYRIFTTKCSVMGSLSKILRRFSGMLKLRLLETVRLGSDVVPFNSEGSQRTIVNNKRVKVRTLLGIVHRPGLGSLPFCLRAPLSSTKRGRRVTELQSLT